MQTRWLSRFSRTCGLHGVTISALGPGPHFLPPLSLNVIKPEEPGGTAADLMSPAVTTATSVEVGRR